MVLGAKYPVPGDYNLVPGACYLAPDQVLVPGTCLVITWYLICIPDRGYIEEGVGARWFILSTGIGERFWERRMGMLEIE